MEWKTTTTFRQNISSAVIQLKKSADILRQSVSQCLICHQCSPEHPRLCQCCYQQLSVFKLANLSGDLLHWPAIDKLFKQRKFDRLVSVTPYEWPLSHWLQQLKYQNRHDYVDLLSFLLAKQFSFNQHFLPAIDITTSVPTHLSKWTKRGFNPAHIIAQKFIQSSQLAYQPNLIIQRQAIGSQVGKSGKQRRLVKGRFELNSAYPVTGKHILLVDDVITTGTTVNEISRLLKKAGAASITVLTLCISLD